jgi:hypothetical protein
MMLDTQTSFAEDSLVDLVVGVAVEAPDGQVRKQWARFAAQASMLDLMAVTATAYNAFWWRLMAVNASKHAVDSARAGRWSWVLRWLDSQLTEVSREAHCWEEVVHRLTALSASGVRAAWWLRCASEQYERMAALAQQVQSVILALCTTLGLAVPKGVGEEEHVSPMATTEDEVGAWHE